jgi:flagellar biosynthesis/type III secretory pathway M-ring protein FliF/YscJ
MLPPPLPHLQDAELVTVTSHWDPPSTPPEPEAIGAVGMWLGEHPLAASCGVLVLVAAGLGMAFCLRASTTDPPSSTATVREMSQSISADSPVSGTVGDEENSPDVREAIATLVRQNPESAAALIRSWLDKAA